MATGGAFLESPRRHDGRLWVFDFRAREVVAITPNGKTRCWPRSPGSPSGLRWAPDGALLLASLLDRKLQRVDSGKGLVVGSLIRLLSSTTPATSLSSRLGAEGHRMAPRGATSIAATPRL